MGAHRIDMDLVSRVPKTDYHIFIGAADVMLIGGATFTNTRIAANIYSLLKTAAGDTTHIYVPVGRFFRANADRGMRIQTFSVCFINTTADLTTHTATCASRLFADSAASTLATFGGTLTGTLGIGQDADPQVDTLTLGTPIYNNTLLADVNLEIAVVAAATSVYSFLGVFVNCDVNYL